MSKGGGGGQQQQGGGGGGDNSTDFLWMIAGIIIACGFIWYFGKAYIVAGVFKVRDVEIHLIHAVMAIFALTPSDTVAQWLSYITNPNVDTSQVDFKTVRDLSHVVGRYISYPVLLLLGSLAVYLYLTNVVSKFKNIFTMDKLKRNEVAIWPSIKPVLETNLIEADIDEGPWAMSVQPLPFAKKYNLVKETRKNGQPHLELIPGAAHRQFSMQLGPFWDGLESLPPYLQALFAIFAAKGDHNNEGAAKMLAQISRSFGTGKLDFSGVRSLLVKHIRSKGIGRVVGMHAYLYTVMPSMLVYARTAGVMATAEFLWLKTVDRELWYMLCSVGRLTAFPEVSGPFAHWLVEKRLRRPLKTPMVGEAVTALESALADIKYNPDKM